MFYDIRFNLTHEPKTSDSNIIIVDIGDKSIQTQGRWPWNRKKIAKLIEKSSEAGAAVIALDIFFSESQLDSDAVVETKSEKIISAADMALANAIQSADVVLGMMFHDKPEHTSGTPIQSNLQFDTGDLSNIASFQFSGLYSNLPSFQKNAAGAGFTNVIVDSDGFIRSSLLLANYENQFYPSLALEAVRQYLVADSIRVRTEDYGGVHTISHLMIGPHVIDTDAVGSILVPFKGPAKSFQYVSATDLLNDRVEPDSLQNALVFVGTSALGIADFRSTPVGISYPGVEVHANVAQALLNPEYLVAKSDYMFVGTLVLILLLGIALSTLLPGYGAIGICIVSLSTLAGLIGFDLYMWSVQKISLEMAIPILLCISLFVLNIAMGFYAESARKNSA